MQVLRRGDSVIRGAPSPTPTAPPDFVGFVADHRTSLVRYAILLTGSLPQAEDLVHEVLTKVLPRWGQLTEPLPYVRRAITNEFLAWRRRWSTRNITLAGDTNLDRIGPDHDDGRPDPEMWALIMSLSRPQRTALVLRFYEGFTDAEIAETLGCKPVTVRSHIHRGLTKIRQNIPARSNDHPQGDSDDRL